MQGTSKRLSEAQKVRWKRHKRTGIPHPTIVARQRKRDIYCTEIAPIFYQLIANHNKVTLQMWSDELALRGKFNSKGQPHSTATLSHLRKRIFEMEKEGLINPSDIIIK